jgi:hypothetical protein
MVWQQAEFLYRWYYCRHQFENGKFVSSLNQADSLEVKTFATTAAIPFKDAVFRC